MNSVTTMNVFKEKMLKEVSDLSKVIIDIFCHLILIKNAQEDIATHLGGHNEKNNFHI